MQLYSFEQVSKKRQKRETKQREKRKQLMYECTIHFFIAIDK